MRWIGSRVSSRIPRVVALALGPLSWLAETVPSLSVGAGVPAADEADGSIYLRTDAGSASTAVYVRVGGVWSTVGSSLSPALDALGALTPAADRVPYFTGATTAALATFTAQARTLLAAATQADQRTALGVTSTADLASTANAKGASLIGVEDSGGLLTATTVEAALAEIAAVTSRQGVIAPIGADVPTTDNATGASSGLSFPVTTGKVYEITWDLRISTASLTNGFRIAPQETGGASSSRCDTTLIYTTSSGTDGSASGAAGTFTANVTGPALPSGSAGDTVLATGRTLYTCTGTGTLTLWFRPETSGSAATMRAGSCATWHALS